MALFGWEGVYPCRLPLRIHLHLEVVFMSILFWRSVAWTTYLYRRAQWLSPWVRRRLAAARTMILDQSLVIELIQAFPCLISSCSAVVDLGLPILRSGVFALSYRFLNPRCCSNRTVQCLSKRLSTLMPVSTLFQLISQQYEIHLIIAHSISLCFANVSPMLSFAWLLWNLRIGMWRKLITC